MSPWAVLGPNKGPNISKQLFGARVGDVCRLVGFPSDIIYTSARFRWTGLQMYSFFPATPPIQSSDSSFICIAVGKHTGKIPTHLIARRLIVVAPIVMTEVFEDLGLLQSDFCVAPV